MAQSGDPMTLEQGHLGLLESDVAQRLLASRIPARFAYIAGDGTPRVLATWFHWTGEVLAMPTFLAAPHGRHPAGRLRALRANPDVAVTIDTEAFPPEVLTVRGRVEITEVEGIPAEYASAARRYLGDQAAEPLFTLEDWDQLVADHLPPNVLLVAVDETRSVVGYTAVHPADGEMFLLFVHPAYAGRGIGRTLLAAAHDALRAAGCSEAFLFT